MSLACGGRGPCCHIGYAHRHCEHCDYVIPLQHFHGGYFYQQPYYWTNLLSSAGQQFSQLANQTQLNQLAEGHTHAG